MANNASSPSLSSRGRVMPLGSYSFDLEEKRDRRGGGGCPNIGNHDDRKRKS